MKLLLLLLLFSLKCEAQSKDSLNYHVCDYTKAFGQYPLYLHKAIDSVSISMHRYVTFTAQYCRNCAIVWRDGYLINRQPYVVRKGKLIKVNWWRWEVKSVKP